MKTSKLDLLEGVPTYSDLILGLPGKLMAHLQGVSRLIENGYNRIQFNNLSILPILRWRQNYQKISDANG